MSLKTFAKLYFFQLFDIGKSTGSLINEAIGLFRLFQRLNAAKSFSLIFSKECLEMFKWATDFLKLILFELLKIKPFTEYQRFICYSMIFPLSLITFFLSLITGRYFLLTAIEYGGSVSLSILLASIKNTTTNCIIMTITFNVIPILIFIILFNWENLKKYCCCHKIKVSAKTPQDDIENPKSKEKDEKSDLSSSKSDYEDSFKMDNKNTNRNSSDIDINNIGCFSKLKTSDDKFILTMSVWPAFLILIGLNFPTFYGRAKFSLILVGLLIFFTLSTFIIELIFELLKKTCVLRSYIPKIIIFLSNFFTLFIIPSTNSFFNLIEMEDKNDWQIFSSYTTMSLLLPILLTFLMIYIGYPEICDNYKTREKGFNFYPYFELLSLIKLISYALFAGFDMQFVCIGIELTWVCLISIFRPFKNISDLILNYGESIVLLIGNVITICVLKSKEGFLNFGAAISLVCIACLPAICAFFTYFCFDFEAREDHSEDKNTNQQNFYFSSIIVGLGLIFSPLGLLFYMSYVIF